MSAALNATGRPITFSLCQWGEANVWEWGAKLGQMYRVQGGTGWGGAGGMGRDGVRWDRVRWDGMNSTGGTGRDGCWG